MADQNEGDSAARAAREERAAKTEQARVGMERMQKRAQAIVREGGRGGGRGGGIHIYR